MHRLSALRGAHLAVIPDKLRPALPFPARQPPAGDRWLHEIKLDGYRMLCRLDRGRLRFTSRQGLDWTDRLGPIGEAVLQVPARQAILDGEIVVHAPDGTTSLRALQSALGRLREAAIVYYVFDLMYLDGYDLTRVALERRQALLAQLVDSPRDATGRLRFSQSIAGDGPAVFRQACRLGLEGIVSKRRDSQYSYGRTRSWLKVKCRRPSSP
jgi:bifunctional non-homologous end joining protein LigD